MKIEFDTAKTITLFFMLALHSPMLAADNRTISGAFDGDEATMAASPGSCDDDAKKFLEAGTIQVSTSDTYTVVDAGNDFQFFGPDSSIADVVVILYEGSFDSNSPATNRVAVADVGANVALNTGTDYVVVVQHWCEEIVGAWAAVIDGPGSISGAGFTSLAYTQGEFLEAGDTAAFGELGEHRYEATDPVILPRGGNFFFADLGSQFNGSFINLWVYQNSFDPDNPQNNLVAQSPLAPAGMITLEAGTYIFVAVDFADIVNRWQFVLFPPGNLTFNPGLSGAWGTLGVDAAGILMEIFPETGLAFFAWFTYPDQPLVVSAQESSSEASGGGKTKPEAHLGSDDQRWLTAFGILPDDGNFMNIAYENSTGGLFNQATPVATIDSNYGTGWIELFNCSFFALNYNLPDGLVRTTEMRRLVNDGLEYCRSFIKAAPPSPPF